MPLDPEFVECGERNQDLLNSLDIQSTDHLDWVVTIAFYVALRYVDAYFSPDRPHDHGERLQWVVQRQRTRPIARQYRELLNQSITARYELAEFDKVEVSALVANTLSKVVAHMQKQ